MFRNEKSTFGVRTNHFLIRTQKLSSGNDNNLVYFKHNNISKQQVNFRQYGKNSINIFVEIVC